MEIMTAHTKLQNMETDRIIIIGNLQPDNNRKWGGYGCRIQ